MEHDKRQLERMIIALLSYEHRKIDLHSLQATLEFLLHALHSVEDSWEDAFLDEISMIASINAEEPDDPSIDVKKIIDESVFDLKKIIQKKLENQ